jgi:hypothetical protein
MYAPRRALRSAPPARARVTLQPTHNLAMGTQSESAPASTPSSAVPLRARLLLLPAAAVVAAVVAAAAAAAVVFARHMQADRRSCGHCSSPARHSRPVQLSVKRRWSAKALWQAGRQKRTGWLKTRNTLICRTSHAHAAPRFQASLTRHSSAAVPVRGERQGWQRGN